MRIENIEIDYYVDHREKAVHVLEKTKKYNSLPDIVSSLFKIKLAKEARESNKIMTYEWYLYCQNRLIFAYSNYNLIFIGKNDKRLYRPFIDAIRPHA
jgi:hypothetical protein